MSLSGIEPALHEVAEWNVMDGNVRVGRSGLYPQLALEKDALLAEMDRFGIGSAVVTHSVAEEYDVSQGNAALRRDLHQRFVPAWAASPEPEHLEFLAVHKPQAVRLFFGVSRNNFSSAPWCCGTLYDYLQENAVLMMTSREDIEWNALAEVLEAFPRLNVLLLDIGYRADRYLFPLLRKFANLYFDTSTYVAHRQLETFVERFGPDRAIYGSRLPLYTPGTALGVLASARIREEAKLAIAGGNLRRLLRPAEQSHEGTQRGRE